MIQFHILSKLNKTTRF